MATAARCRETLPRAVRLTLELEDFGEIRRVLELPQEPPA